MRNIKDKYLIDESIIRTIKAIKSTSDLYKIFSPVLDVIYDVSVAKNNKRLSSSERREMIKKSSYELYQLAKEMRADPLYVDIVKAIAIIVNKHA